METTEAVCDECGATFVLASGSPSGERPSFVQCDECRAAPRPRTTGNVDEYRSPMQAGSFVMRGMRAYHDAPGRERSRHGRRPPNAAAVHDDTYRAPAFGGQLGVPGAAPPARRAGAGRAHANGSRPGPNRASLGSRRESGKPRPDAPSFEITCSECGARAAVPFEPAPGREVFCNDCFRERRKARGG